MSYKTKITPQYPPAGTATTEITIATMVGNPGPQGPKGDTGPTGPQGDTGPTGDKGWSPTFAVVSDGDRRVLQVDDWVGGEGSKPATGDYVGATGLVSAIADAVDIRGPEGTAGDPTDLSQAGAAHLDGIVWSDVAGAWEVGPSVAARILAKEVRQGKEPVLLHDFANDAHHVINPDDATGLELDLSRIWTFARNSTVNGWTAGPVLTEFASGAPAFVIDPATGQALGYRALAGSTNKCTNHNLNPDAALTNISASAGTLERVDDSANLPLSNQFDGNAFHLNNATGGSVTITVTGQCGNTNAHSIGVLCRFTGTAPTVQLTGGDGAATCSNNYDETKSEGITPSATTDQWQLVVPNGTEVWFVANQLEEGAFISSWIEAEGATGSTAADAAEEPLPASCQDGFVVIAQARMSPLLSANFMLFSIEGSTLDNAVAVYRNTIGNLVLLVDEASTRIVSTAVTGVGENVDFKLAVRAENGRYALCVNGASVSTSNASGFPNSLVNALIGYSGYSNSTWNSTIASMSIYDNPADWSDADLQEVTS